MLIFVEGGKLENPEKNPCNKDETEPQTQPTYGTRSTIWTWAILVGGKRDHHCATPVPLVGVRVKCLAQKEHNMMSPARALFKTALTESSALSIKPAPPAPHSIERGEGGLILCQLQFIINSFYVPDKPLHVTIWMKATITCTGFLQNDDYCQSLLYKFGFLIETHFSHSGSREDFKEGRENSQTKSWGM